MLETPPFADSPRTLPEPRRRVLDNPRVLAVAFALLLALIAGLFWLSRRTAETETQVLTDVLLYPLLAVSVALLLTLGLVLTRNLLNNDERAEAIADILTNKATVEDTETE